MQATQFAKAYIQIWKERPCCKEVWETTSPRKWKVVKGEDFDRDHVRTACDCGTCKCRDCGAALAKLKPFLCVEGWLSSEDSRSCMLCPSCVANHAEECSTLRKLAS